MNLISCTSLSYELFFFSCELKHETSDAEKCAIFIYSHVSAGCFQSLNSAPILPVPISPGKTSKLSFHFGRHFLEFLSSFGTFAIKQPSCMRSFNMKGWKGRSLSRNRKHHLLAAALGVSNLKLRRDWMRVESAFPPRN